MVKISEKLDDFIQNLGYTIFDYSLPLFGITAASFASAWVGFQNPDEQSMIIGPIGLGVFTDYKGKVKDYYHENAFKNFIKTRSIKIISSGGGVVPVRRPLWSCAADGIIFIGDAGCQVNPLHGGGIAVIRYPGVTR